jgi:hypothetical protein
MHLWIMSCHGRRESTLFADLLAVAEEYIPIKKKVNQDQH